MPVANSALINRTAPVTKQLDCLERWDCWARICAQPSPQAGTDQHGWALKQTVSRECERPVQGTILPSKSLPGLRGAGDVQWQFMLCDPWSEGWAGCTGRAGWGPSQCRSVGMCCVWCSALPECWLVLLSCSSSPGQMEALPCKTCLVLLQCSQKNTYFLWFFHCPGVPIPLKSPNHRELSACG